MKVLSYGNSWHARAVVQLFQGVGVVVDDGLEVVVDG